MGYKEEGKWWVSQSNYVDEVVSKFNFAPNIEILDTTLRDGEQQPNIILKKNDKIAIAKKLDEAGVHRIEAGTPAASKEDAEAIKEICQLGLKAKVFAFVRNVKSDIQLAKDCGVYGVLAEVPGSNHLLKHGMKWTAEKAIKAACESTRFAHELGLYVTFFPADGSRADLDFLLSTLQAIIEGGGHVDSIALVDTFGAFSPEGAAYTVKTLIDKFGLPVEAHFHEDFGLSVSTTIAALTAGASVAHVTVNGIGERAGSCPLEPLALSLNCLYGVDTGIKTEKLMELSKLVEERTKFPVPPTKAVVGKEIFGWETGMPSNMWMNSKDVDPLIMLPYRWELTGNTEPYIFLGKKSGSANILMWLKKYNLELDEDKRGKLLDMVKEFSIEKGRVLTGDEFKELVNNCK
ncbi:MULTISPECIES: LeuA family protein [unclassified Sedimentibacter]|uniref:LeuA family protein n=1 Tax=unclassified Sedimentibacter TaxID=2649220 RepID=UPI001BD4E38A|nr:pyruvate carboxyltransferase [Sedimentibacter sp. MB35-C1]WMJ77743.1 pyruvate carboxyltransferase [Sedimentibacter sp. MB35-C1]